MTDTQEHTWSNGFLESQVMLHSGVYYEGKRYSNRPKFLRFLAFPESPEQFKVRVVRNPETGKTVLHVTRVTATS